MRTVNLIKQFLSRFTDTRINKGIGVTTDETVTFQEIPTIAEIEQDTTSSCVTYVLRQRIGKFELVGLVKRGDDTMYKLRHAYTGESFTVSEVLFHLLFKKYDNTKECND